MGGWVVQAFLTEGSCCACCENVVRGHSQKTFRKEGEGIKHFVTTGHKRVTGGEEG